MDDVLEEICARFLLNLPEDELKDKSRLGFQLEQAFWFYEDFSRPSSRNKLPKLNMRSFCQELARICPKGFLPSFADADSISALVLQFQKYKRKVPTCGAVLLNREMDKCLLVQGFGTNAGWGFPKGKISKEESPSECAIREVFEEIGFDISPHLLNDEYIQVSGQSNQQPMRLYIIPNISESQKFKCMTRGEIKRIKWHKIKNIEKLTYHVSICTKKLIDWIESRKHQSLPYKSNIHGSGFCQDLIQTQENFSIDITDFSNNFWNKFNNK